MNGKKIAFLAAAALAVSAAALVPSRSGAPAGGPAQAQGASEEGAAASAARLAEAPLAAPEAVEKLDRAALEAKIAEIDGRIEKQHLVERSNRGELGEDQLAELRRLLHKRNEYFLRKIDLDLGQG